MRPTWSSFAARRFPAAAAAVGAWRRVRQQRRRERRAGHPAPEPPSVAVEPLPTAAAAPENPAPPDDWRASSPADCSEADVARWNAEWLDYLSREWPYQLTPWTAFPSPPPLPATARELLSLQARPGWELALYCDPEWLAGRRVLELGCGCGGLGKLLGGWVESYLGTDYSTLALQVARLVSPPRCSYLHVGDRAALARHHGSVETVIGRYFWIHQNLELGRANLDFLAPFLVPGGRLYADFFCPDRAQEQFVVRRPEDPLSRRWPSAMFHYETADVERLVAGRPFRLLRDEVVPERQRRYAVLERTA